MLRGIAIIKFMCRLPAPFEFVIELYSLEFITAVIGIAKFILRLLGNFFPLINLLSYKYFDVLTKQTIPRSDLLKVNRRFKHANLLTYRSRQN